MRPLLAFSIVTLPLITLAVFGEHLSPGPRSGMLHGAVASPSVAPGPSICAVFFDWDQALLSEHARETLAGASQAAAGGHAVNLSLRALDDSGAGRSYGAALALARWRSVVAELRRDGVFTDQIVPAGPQSVVVRPRMVAFLQPASAASAR